MLREQKWRRFSFFGGLWRPLRKRERERAAREWGRTWGGRAAVTVTQQSGCLWAWELPSAHVTHRAKVCRGRADVCALTASQPSRRVWEKKKSGRLRACVRQGKTSGGRQRSQSQKTRGHCNLRNGLLRLMRLRNYRFQASTYSPLLRVTIYTHLAGGGDMSAILWLANAMNDLSTYTSTHSKSHLHIPVLYSYV